MNDQWNSKVVANPDMKSYDVHRVVVVEQLPDVKEEGTLYLVPEA